MDPGVANTNRPLFLNGWKQIADYLGKGVRTVQRYERNFRLPVRRPSGRSEGAVMATPAEIDAWFSASTRRPMLMPLARVGVRGIDAEYRTNDTVAGTISDCQKRAAHQPLTAEASFPTSRKSHARNS